MDREELRAELQQAGIEISDTDIFWMERVHERSQTGENTSVGELLVRYHDDLPDDYIPSEQIDSALYSEDRDEPPSLTLLGKLLVDEDSDIPVHVNAVLEAARHIILDNPETTEIEADEVTDRLRKTPSLPALDIAKVERAFGHASELGSFWTSASGANHADEGYSRMGFSRNAASYILEYLNFDGFDSMLQSKIEEFEDSSEPGGLITPSSFKESRIGPSGLSGLSRQSPLSKGETDTRKNTAFIMMPMDPDQPTLEDVNNTIKDVCSEFGIEAVRADDVEHSRRITDVVLEHIERCEFLIADLTNARPNVYYEVGYAHALDKRPILYRRKGAGLHFDLSVHNVPEYRNMTDLEEKLRERFEAIMGRRPDSAS